jgi:hypothetical protein
MIPEYRSWGNMNSKRIELSQPSPEDDSDLFDTVSPDIMLYETMHAISELITAMKGVPSLEDEVRQLGVFATQIVLGDQAESTDEKSGDIDT